MLPPQPVSHAAAMVDALWANVAHRPEIAERLTVFPRDLAHLLLYGLEIPIITVHGLTLHTADRYLCILADVRTLPTCDTPDRPVYGLLHVGPPSTTVFLEGSLPAHIANYVLAHEVGHVLADIYAIQRLWQQTLPTQQESVQRFFAWQRTSDWLELLAAIKGLPARPTIATDPRRISQDELANREIQADLVARELLAPWHTVITHAPNTTQSDLAALLYDQYGLPRRMAWSYARHLRDRVTPPLDVVDRLFGHLLSCNDS